MWHGAVPTPHSPRWEAKLESIEANFSVMHINCRSMVHKLDEIREVLSQLPVSILALSETWLESEFEDTIHMPNYKFIHKSREGNRGGGGVGLFVRDTIKFQLYEEKSEHKTYEGLFIKTYLPSTTCLVGVLYRPPGQNLVEFNAEIEVLFSSIVKGTKDIVLLGDFNIDLLKINEHKETNIFYNNLTSHQLIPAITKPTRITPTSSTLIDNIFTNAWSSLIDSTIFIADLSDHLPVFAHFAFGNYKRSFPNYYDHRIINEERSEQFKSLLADSNWDNVSTACNNGDADGAYEVFIEKYKNAYDQAFPIVSKKNNAKGSRFKQPWMTAGLLKSSKKKASLYLKYIKNPNAYNKNKFTVYRNKFKAIRVKAEKITMHLNSANIKTT
jgi:exonuclease III